MTSVEVRPQGNTMTRMLSLIAGASLLALAGTANAGPVTMTDAQLDGVSAGWGLTHYQNIFIANNVYSNTHGVSGNSAVAEAGAEAYGNNSFSKTQTGTLTNSYFSGSSSFSSSSTN